MARPRSANPSPKALYQREWYERNKEKARSYQATYKEKDPDGVREKNTESQRLRRSRDPEPSRRTARRYRKSHPDRVARQIAASKAKKPELYREISRRAERRWRAANPDKRVLSTLKRSCASVGITLDQYYQALDAQGGACWICKKPPTTARLYLDHCHSGGVFRGLLCRECNSGLGQFRDNPELLRRAAEYLENTSK